MVKRTTVREDIDCAAMLLRTVELQVDAMQVLEWVAERFDPGDVFDANQLADWAEENDFVQKKR